jgi:hypothetical protein
VTQITTNADAAYSTACTKKQPAAPKTAMRYPASAGPKMRINEKPMVLSATAFVATSRGTSSKAAVMRAGRSMTLDAPISSVKPKSIHVFAACAASAAPTANDTAHASAWLACINRRRSRRSAATPDMGVNKSIGIARTPSTAPTSAPEPVIS